MTSFGMEVILITEDSSGEESKVSLDVIDLGEIYLNKHITMTFNANKIVALQQGDQFSLCMPDGDLNYFYGPFVTDTIKDEFEHCAVSEITTISFHYTAEKEMKRLHYDI